MAVANVFVNNNKTNGYDNNIQLFSGFIVGFVTHLR